MKRPDKKDFEIESGNFFYKEYSIAIGVYCNYLESQLKEKDKKVIIELNSILEAVENPQPNIEEWNSYEGVPSIGFMIKALITEILTSKTK